MLDNSIKNSDIEMLIKNYTGEIAGVKEFQKKTVQCLAKKFFCEEKSKLVLADEVGMGKTYVCRGMIELGKMIKQKPFTVVYIAPNEYVSKQNLSELCDGFIRLTGNAKVKNERLSALKVKEQKEDYRIVSFSAGMFFNTDDGTAGTKEERKKICQYIVDVFFTLYHAENSTDELKTKLDKYFPWLEMLFSAMANASLDGEECRYKYYDSITNQPKEVYLKKFSRAYEEFRSMFQTCTTLDAEEALAAYNELEEICRLSEEEYINTIKEIEDEIKKTGKTIEEFVKERYALQANRPSLPEKLSYSRNPLEQKILTLLVPYYLGDFGENYRKEVNGLFKEIREVANRMNYRRLSPDLIILDEFHKYFSEDIRKKLMRYLEYNPNTKVLLVSATPYKMNLRAVNLMSEQIEESELEDSDEALRKRGKNEVITDTCFGGYSDLYLFLSEKEEIAKEIERKFDSIVSALKKLQTAKQECFIELWKLCKENKEFIQKNLREYIVRTERAALQGKTNTDVKLFSEDELTPEEVRYDCTMVREMLRGNIPVNQALLYTKMAPYPMSFSKRYESLGYPGITEKNAEDKFKIGLRNLSAECFWNGVTMPEHFRINRLLAASNWSDALKKALWIPATGSDKLRGFWRELSEFSKIVVFARHIMTTKSVSAILSAQLMSQQNIVQELDDDVFLPRNVDGVEKKCEEGEHIGEPEACFFKALMTVCEDKNNVSRKAHEYAKAFYGYLKKNKAVLRCAGVKNRKELLQYCADGDLEGVLAEYVFLLTKGKKLKQSAKPGESDTFWKRLDILKEVFRTNANSIVEYYKKNQDGEITVGTVTCSIAELYSEDTENKEHIKEAFNSPFYPFYLVTTPLAQEGLNFQSYAYKTFHWRIPVSPIDYEQREGRVNRYRNLAVRKNVKKEYGKENETWKELFERAEKRVLEKGESFGGVNPDWVTITENGINIQSYMVSHPESKEKQVQDVLLKAVDNYRVSLGYGISNDVVEGIRKNALKLGISYEMAEILIDLTPMMNF